MRIRWIPLLLVLALLLTALPVRAQEPGSACGKDLEWSFDETAGMLRIAGSGAMEPWVNAASVPWHDISDRITGVRLPAGLTDIGKNAFSGCTALREVTIPSGVTEIGMYAFSGCAALTKAALPETLKTVGMYAFSGCTGLTEITVPAAVKDIGVSAFRGCSSLSAIRVAEDNRVYSSSQGVLLNKDRTRLLQCPCGKTGAYKVPAGVKHIGANAFFSCAALTDVTIPSGVETVGDSAFRGCAGLTAASIPNSVKRIGVGAFRDCTGLTEAAIPDSVTAISDSLFRDCAALARIGIGSGVMDIGEYAFSGTAYHSAPANWSGGLLYLGDWLISARTDVREARLRAGVKGIADRTFLSCANLTDVTFPAGLEYIGEAAFMGCGALTEATIPDSVKRLGDSAFFGCDGLKKISIGSGVTAIGEAAFCDCDSLAEAEIPAGVKRIGARAFYLCRSLVCLTVRNASCEICEETDALVRGVTLGDPAVTTVRGSAASTAKAYAQRYGYPFRALIQGTGFSDVPAKAFYADAVAWAVEQGITRGVDAAHFGPDLTCTRGQVVTFLWRACGSPKPKTVTNPFTDVRPGSFCYQAVLWAVENGITNGTGKTAFSPDDGCTRAQAVTFLWRTDGRPAPKGTDHPFTDVRKGAFCDKAVTWAMEQGITKGTGKTTFSPDETCTRAQIVTFLYRDRKK